MPSTYTVNLGIEKPATGEQSGTWGDTTNTNFDILDQGINGAVRVTLTSAGSSGSPNALQITNGAASDGRNKWIEFYSSGDLGGSAYVQLDPNDAEKIVFIRNSLASSRSVLLFQGTYSASRDLEIPAGVDMVVKFDGGGASAATVTDVYTKLRATEITTPTLTTTTADINGDLTLTGASYNAVWDSSDSALEFADNAKAIFGAGSDLQIYHDGSNSYIKDNGTGDLKLQGNNFTVGNTADTKYFTATNGGGVELYHQGNEKLATTSGGINVTGEVQGDSLDIDGNADIAGTLSLDDTLTVVRTDGIPSVNVNGIKSDNGYQPSQLNFNRYGATTGTATPDSSTIGDIRWSGLDSAGSPAYAMFANITAFIGANASGGAPTTLTFGVGDTGSTAAEKLRIMPGSTVVNELSTDYDFRVESDNNANMLFVDGGTDRVGIGTNAPSHALDVFKSAGTVARIRNTAATGATPSTTHGELVVESTDANMGMQFLGSTTANQRILFGDTDAGGSGQVVYDHTSNYMSFSANGAERLRIDSSGNVGIGESVPAAKLHVRTGDYGGGGVASAGDELILEAGGNGGMTIATPNTNDGVIYFADPEDQDPGVIYYRHSNDTLFFHAGAAQRLKLNAAENVFNEIGVDTDFRVESNNNANMLFVDGSADSVGIGTSAPDSALHVYKQTNDRSARFQRLSTQYIDIGQTSGINEIKSTGKNLEIGTTDALDFIIDTNNAERLRIASNGRVGIGTSTPDEALHIDKVANSSIRLGETGRDYAYLLRANVSDSVNGGFLIEDAESGNDLYKVISGASGSHKFFINGSAAERAHFGPTSIIFNDTSDDVDFRVESNGNTHMLFVDGGNDNVHIGSSAVTSQSVPLQVGTGQANQIVVKGSGSGFTQGGIIIEGGTDSTPGTRGQGIYYFNEGNDRTYYSGTLYNNGTVWGVGSGSSTSLALGAADTTNAVLAVDGVNGRVGIGDSSPAAILEITQASNLSESTAHLRISGAGYAAFHWLDGTAYYIGQNGGSRSLRLYSSAESAGVELSAGATSFTTFSDERLKENVEPIKNALQSLSNLRTVKYHLKDVDSPEDRKKIGVIAQDLVGVIDEVIDPTFRSDDNTEYMGVRYTELVPVLIKAIQEQQDLIESLTARVAKLEAN